MLKIFNSKELNQEGLIDLDFALGKAYEDKLDYEISFKHYKNCLLYTSPSPRDTRESRMPSSA